MWTFWNLSLSEVVLCRCLQTRILSTAAHSRWGNVLRDVVLTDQGQALGYFEQVHTKLQEVKSFRNLEHNVARNLSPKFSVLSGSPLVNMTLSNYQYLPKVQTYQGLAQWEGSSGQSVAPQL